MATDIDQSEESTQGVRLRVELGLVAPFRNEEPCLPAFTDALRTELDALDCPYEVVMVDDGSTDGGWDWLKKAQDSWPELTLVRLARGFGKEAAIKAGLARSWAEAVIVLDADLQHPVELIPEMHKTWKESGAWVVEAVKRGAGGRTPLNRLGASLFYRLGEWATQLELRNRSDFQLLDKRVVELFLAMPERMTVFRGIIAWLGLPSRKIPFDVPPRVAGRSRWSMGKLFSLGLDMITGFTNAPLRIMTYAALFFGASATILGVQTLYMYLTGQALEGFTTVILAVLITGTVITIGLGIIGEYLARIYEEVKARPQFVVEEVRTGRDR